VALERSEIVEETGVPAGLDVPEYVIEEEEFESRHVLEERVLDWLTTLRTAGGMFSVAAVRQKVGVDPFGMDVFVPVRYVLRFNSFVPAETQATQQAALGADELNEAAPAAPAAVE
jgi:hypothetical protein